MLKWEEECFLNLVTTNNNHKMKKENQPKESTTEVAEARNTKWGGARKNAGRKKKYGEVTKVLTSRIPVSKIDEVKRAIAYILNNK